MSSPYSDVGNQHLVTDLVLKSFPISAERQYRFSLHNKTTTTSRTIAELQSGWR